MLLVQPSAAPASNPAVRDSPSALHTMNVTMAVEQAAAKVAEGLAKIKFQSTFKKHQNDGHGAKKIRRARKTLRVH